ncbi:MAG: GTP cyclohydrolase FolE2 [Planctomycetota bacterium]|jgi:GTP cyclohydrolase I
MEDVQSQRDGRNIEVDKVGVKNLRYPIVVLDRRNKEQPTVANANMYVRLPHRFRGTHMSRFLEILNDVRGRISIGNIHEILQKTRAALDSEEAHLELTFPYFIEKEAPVTGARSLMEYRCTFLASQGKEMDFVLGVEVPVHTLCPCSREISEEGAHNQRSVVRVRVRFKDFVWIEDLVALVEGCASSPIYPLLKREDEKFVTEQAYRNPRFAEDVVRQVSQALERVENVVWYSVESENQESIHNHSAYAFVERDLRDKTTI